MPFLFYSLIGISSSTLIFFGNPFPSSNAFSIAFLLFTYVYSEPHTTKVAWFLSLQTSLILSFTYVDCILQHIRTNLF